MVLAIDPKIIWNDDAGLTAFKQRVAAVCERVRNAKKLDGVDEIFLPGERGDQIAARRINSDTIEIETNLFNDLCRMAGV